MSQKVTHVVFSDESNWNKGRYRSLALVTLPIEYLECFNDELTDLFRSSSISGEFKWKNVRGSREKFAAQKICNFAIENARHGRLRIDGTCSGSRSDTG